MSINKSMAWGWLCGTIIGLLIKIFVIDRYIHQGFWLDMLTILIGAIGICVALFFIRKKTT